MRLIRLVLDGHRSVEHLDFAAGPFTVLFGRNNAGKTNILETIARLLDPSAGREIRQTHTDRGSSVWGGAVAQLEQDRPFDALVLRTVSDAYGEPWEGPVTFVKEGVLRGDIQRLEDPEVGIPDPLAIEAEAIDGPRLHPLLLDWRAHGLHERVEAAIARMASTEAMRRRGDSAWLEMLKIGEDEYAYRVPTTTDVRLAQLSSLASDLLPDFIDGTIDAQVTAATIWERMPKVLLQFDQKNRGQCADLVDAIGEGAGRWMAAAVQIALHLMAEHPETNALRDLPDGAFSGHVLLVDEPEAHLHSSAVASMVRWCHRMVSHGFSVIVASHHEEFLRDASDRITLVRVVRDAEDGVSEAEAVPFPTTAQLLELADHVGMNPAAALSLQRAILFVEGPLDEAVLDAYGRFDLDAAGVLIVPIHGTRNLEGLLTAELVLGLGLRLGILTDATEVATMPTRSNKKRSSEEKKVLRVIQIAEAKGLPVPTAFGVAEDDLLFALPPEAISRYYLGGRPFPEWKQLVAECREAEGKTSAESVNWKQYAHETYGLPLTTPEDVRHIVHTLDLNGVELRSVRQVIDEIVAWARHS